MKVLFQGLCRFKQEWDAPLEADLKRKFENWLMELRKVKCIRLNRYYLGGGGGGELKVLSYHWSFMATVMHQIQHMQQLSILRLSQKQTLRLYWLDQGQE